MCLCYVFPLFVRIKYPHSGDQWYTWVIDVQDIKGVMITVIRSHIKVKNYN